jgi:squalene synthase HpnC
MPVDHYENFPVASVLLPRRLRPAVEAIYAFARSADDLADEGDATPALRLAALAEFEQALDAIVHGGALPPLAQTRLFTDLAQVLREYKLPSQPLFDLLSAFRQDVGTTRYATYASLLDYCRRSANPVGRLMLHLYDAADEADVAASDAICTALQLINFWQDVAVDWQKQRVYLPQEDLARFGVAEAQIAARTVDEAWTALMRFELERAMALMRSGSPLAKRLPGRIGWELRLVVQGGLRIAERVHTARGDVFRKRPKLRTRDWLLVFWRAARM